MKKSIKIIVVKWLKRILISLGILITSIILLLAIILFLPPVQSYLAKKTVGYFAENYDVDLSIDKIKLRLPTSVELTDLTFRDPYGDTILYSSVISANIVEVGKLFNRKLYVDNVLLEKPSVNIALDSLGKTNFSFLLEKFSSDKEKDTVKSKGIDIFCNNLKVKDASFKFKDVRDSLNGNSKLFNPKDIYAFQIDINVEKFKFCNDTIDLNISKFNFQEKSGIDIKEFTSNFRYFESGMSLKDFVIRTNVSEFKCQTLSVEGKDSKYLSDPLNKMKVELDIDTLELQFSDLSCISHQFRQLKDKLCFSGSFKGNFSKFKFNQLNVAYGENTRAIANLSVDGLDDLKSAFIFGDIVNLRSSFKDISRLVKIFSPKSKNELPSKLNDLGVMSFNGNVTGFLSDLVAYGSFNSNVGRISTDLALVTDFEKLRLKYSGKVNASNINLGMISDSPDILGLLSFNSKVNGSVDSLGNYNMKLNCDVSSLDVYNYNYKEIRINGDASNNSFNGEFFVDDPNLRIEFLGSYEYGKTEKNIDFTSDIYANLNNLNITHDSLPTEIKMVLSSKVKGDIFNRPEGYVRINNLYSSFNGDVYEFEKFVINSLIDKEEKQYLTVRSDYLDANMYGRYDYIELWNIASKTFNTYLPSFFPEQEKVIEYEYPNKLKFNLTLKKLNNILANIEPKLNFENSIFAEGQFEGQNERFELVVSTPRIKYDSIFVWGTEIYVNGLSDSLKLDIAVQEISTKTKPLIENFGFDLFLGNDSLFYSLNWDNHAEKRNAGHISALTKFVRYDNSPKSFPRIESFINESQVIAEDRVWNISETPIIIDSTDVYIQKFNLSCENQELKVDGYISNDESKMLRFYINNVDVSNFNFLLSNFGYSVDGILSASGRGAGLYSKPAFRSSFQILDFKVNKEDFGNFNLSLNWDGKTNGFKVDASNKFLNVKGGYSPKTDSIKFDLLIDNFKLSLVEQYLNDFGISELGGMIDISLSIDGLLSDPSVQGYVEFDAATLVYDLIKLKIFTSDKVYLSRNAIEFKKFRFYDENKNLALVNGGLYHKKFKDLTYDFKIIANNLKALNTTEKDNSLYYGTAYATGDVHIFGDVNKINIDISAKSEPKTVFVLSTTPAYESAKISYLTFFQKEVDSLNNVVMVAKNASANFGVNLKMDIEVTPEAECQIVFDPKVGDLIRGNGKGNIKLEYTENEEMFMYGEMEIVNGDYLFTLENIINKKFHINKGGTITWAGTPFDALVNLDAAYVTKASLKELMIESADSIYNKMVPVECNMHMSGSLMSPEIVFEINIPNSNDKVRAQLASLTQDEVNKQMLYLLIMNKFYATNQDVAGSGFGNTTDAFGSTSAELLSNQLSNWLSQLSKDFDIGFNYRPGTDVSGQEIEVALSTQLINDRVLINGNVGIGNNRSNSGLIGDIEVQFKVNKNGNFRLKGFTRSNDNFQIDLGPYTSGAGIFYTEDFDTFGQLMRKYWRMISFKNYRDRKKEKLEELENPN